MKFRNMCSVGPGCVNCINQTNELAWSRRLSSECVRGSANHDNISSWAPRVPSFTSPAVELWYVELCNMKMILKRMQALLLIHVFRGSFGSRVSGWLELPANQDHRPTSHGSKPGNRVSLPDSPPCLATTLGDPQGTGCLPTDVRLRSTYASRAGWSKGWSRTWIYWGLQEKVLLHRWVLVVFPEPASQKRFLPPGAGSASQHVELSSMCQEYTCYKLKKELMPKTSHKSVEFNSMRGGPR